MNIMGTTTGRFKSDRPNYNSDPKVIADYHKQAKVHDNAVINADFAKLEERVAVNIRGTNNGD